MVNKHFADLNQVIQGVAQSMLRTGKVIAPKKWQGIKAPLPMFEATMVNFSVPMVDDEQYLKFTLKPNLPWADEHFRERVGEEPTNPGETYKIWPFYKRDDEMRKGEIFTHTYMERFWPKVAGDEWLKRQYGTGTREYCNFGIRYDYGDLNTLIKLLQDDPDTRQAYLPIWFPEDTGAAHGGRVPCTLGYMFLIRDGYIHITYYIRSCDFLRHFQDDVYLAILLAKHVRDKV